MRHSGKFSQRSTCRINVLQAHKKSSPPCLLFAFLHLFSSPPRHCCRSVPSCLPLRPNQPELELVCMQKLTGVQSTHRDEARRRSRRNSYFLDWPSFRRQRLKCFVLLRYGRNVVWNFSCLNYDTWYKQGICLFWPWRIPERVTFLLQDK